MVGKVNSLTNEKIMVNGDEEIQYNKNKNNEERSKSISNCESDVEDDEQDGLFDDAKPAGDISRVSFDGSHKIYHFRAFKFDGRSFQIDDSVLVTPEEGKIKPAVVIIKDIFQTEDGDLMVKGQRMYRPEDAEKKEGGTWQSKDHRELFYSRNIDQVPADSVMHKCVIHFVSINKPDPDRKVNPGFVVKKAYDFVQRKLRDLTERECKGLVQPKLPPIQRPAPRPLLGQPCRRSFSGAEFIDTVHQYCSGAEFFFSDVICQV